MVRYAALEPSIKHFSLGRGKRMLIGKAGQGPDSRDRRLAGARFMGIVSISVALARKYPSYAPGCRECIFLVGKIDPRKNIKKNGKVSSSFSVQGG
jgi:hypothetical protein